MGDPTRPSSLTLPNDAPCNDDRTGGGPVVAALLAGGAGLGGGGASPFADADERTIEGGPSGGGAIIFGVGALGLSNN